jgi:hypothetical protein
LEIRKIFWVGVPSHTLISFEKVSRKSKTEPENKGLKNLSSVTLAKNVSMESAEQLSQTLLQHAIASKYECSLTPIKFKLKSIFYILQIGIYQDS